MHSNVFALNVRTPQHPLGSPDRNILRYNDRITDTRTRGH